MHENADQHYNAENLSCVAKDAVLIKQTSFERKI